MTRQGLGDTALVVGQAAVALVAVTLAVLALAGLLAAALAAAARAGRPSRRPARRPTYVARLEPRGAVVYVLRDRGVERLADRGPFAAGDFGWGYAGEGTLDLAHSLLWDVLGHAPGARVAGSFGGEVLERLPVAGFVLTGDEVARWLRDRAALAHGR